VRRNPRVRLEAQIHGGGHERGFRSGTLATHQIVGMGEAFRIAREEMQAEQARLLVPAQPLVEGSVQTGAGVCQWFDLKHRVPAT
jgi:cysteine desulfurase